MEEVKQMEPRRLTEEGRTCLVCQKEIPFDENCYQVRYGALDEEDDDFVVEHEEGYCHLGCLPLTPTM